MKEKIEDLGNEIRMFFNYEEVKYNRSGGNTEMYKAKTDNGETISLKLNIKTGHVYNETYKDCWEGIGNIYSRTILRNQL